VHDPLFARALVLANGAEAAGAYAVVTIDVCGLFAETVNAAQRKAEELTGIPAGQIMLATTHTHSGPATMGFFNQREEAYLQELIGKLARVIQQAWERRQPVAVGGASGREETISHYRRLLADDGHVVMNWVPYPAEHIVGPLGVPDPEVGVLKIVAAGTGEVVCLLFNHAGHPNVLSGDNYLLTAEYPGLAERLLEAQFGGTAIFLNGAQGTMDIDGLRDRDWKGMERIGTALAAAVAETALTITPSAMPVLRGASNSYTIPGRKISDTEFAWAQDIIQQTGGVIQPLADGVGDDYLALLYRDLRAKQDTPIPVEQICFAVGDCAFISFPGELYTEIGMDIKARSPFAHTYIVGLANGEIGYIPTRKAIGEGGYAEDTRPADDSAEDIIVEHSLALLNDVFTLSHKE
jgi:hypothetical protein